MDERDGTGTESGDVTGDAVDADGRVTLYVAVSLDGYVASPDGGVSWLEAFGPSDDEGGPGSFGTFLATVDCLVMGSRTYEQVLSFGEWPYGDRPTVVVTSRDLPRATAAVEFVDTGEREGAGDAGVAELAADLRRRHGHVWLVGGAHLARSFLRADAVDELRLTVAPLLLGDGIPLFGGGHGTDGAGREDDREDGHGAHALSFRGATPEPNGLVELRYVVED
jgi:dihydrofolate reductase